MRHGWAERKTKMKKDWHKAKASIAFVESSGHNTFITCFTYFLFIYHVRRAACLHSIVGGWVCIDDVITLGAMFRRLLQKLDLSFIDIDIVFYAIAMYRKFIGADNWSRLSHVSCRPEMLHGMCKAKHLSLRRAAKKNKTRSKQLYFCLFWHRQASVRGSRVKMLFRTEWHCAAGSAFRANK